MSRLNSWIAALLLSACGSVSAADGVFDRSVEVKKYLNDIQTGTRNTVTETARKITDADLGDPRVAKALFDKLAADLPSLDDRNSVDMKYRKAMIIAIASTGVMEFADKLTPICAQIPSKRNTNFCTEAVSEMEASRRRNEVVASTKYYREGDDVRVTRIMNLLMSDDFRDKHEGVHRMNWGKILDERLTDILAEQLPRYLDSTVRGASSDQIAAIAGYVKVLGYSGNLKYREVIQQVRKSKAGPLIQKRAREALSNLRRVEKQTSRKSNA